MRGESQPAGNWLNLLDTRRGAKTVETVQDEDPAATAQGTVTEEEPLGHPV